ncbi:MAG: alkaline phosphatase family protein [Phycisphaerales bacterium]
MPDGPVKRLLIVGWDAADWHLLDPLMAAGKMPHFRRLVEQGVRAELRTLEPTLSPLLWTTIATGKTADKHGILGFVEPNPSGEGLRISSSTSRRTKALWNILTQSGRRVHALGWYASHPAEPIAGVCVSNLFNRAGGAAPGQAWALPEGCVHAPDALRTALAAARVDPVQERGALLRELIPDAPAQARKGRVADMIAGEWARNRTIHRAALELLRAERAASADWSCAMVFYDAIDTIGHHCMEFRPPRMAHVRAEDVRTFGGVMDRVYMLHDQMLGELLDAAGPGTTVMLLSDHGFYSDHQRPVHEEWRGATGAVVEARWHRPEGVLVLSGPGFRAGETIAAPTLLDIAPTALAALGLPVGADMDGRVVTEAFAQIPAIATVPSWDAQEGESGMHPAEMRNDPFEAREALRQLIDLGYMPDMGGDVAAQLDDASREARFNLGMVFLTTGRPELGVPVFQSLVQERPAEPRFVVPLAQCQLGAGQTADAVATLRAYLEQVPTSTEARILLAGALLEQGVRDEAAAEVERLEREHGTQPAMALALAGLFASLERWETAQRYFAAAIEHAPRNPLVRVAFARALMARGEHERAGEACLDATELQMVLPEAHYILGAALAWLGQLEHAEQSLRNAVTMQPGSIDAQEFLEAVAAAQGHAAIAQVAGQRVQELASALAESGKLARRKPVSWDARAWSARARG